MRHVQLLLLVLIPMSTDAQKASAPFRQVVLDRDGVIRWKDTGDEVTLFGANYAIASSTDYRASGYLTPPGPNESFRCRISASRGE